MSFSVSCCIVFFWQWILFVNFVKLGVWIYKHLNEPNTTFLGAQDTLDAIEKGKTWNVVVDKNA